MPGIALRGYGRAYMAKGGKTPAWQRKEGKSESRQLTKLFKSQALCHEGQKR